MPFEKILAAAEARNPDLATTQHTIDRQALQVDAARKDFKPDFNVQAMWQRTDPTQYRAYYQITFGVKPFPHVRPPLLMVRNRGPELIPAVTVHSSIVFLTQLGMGTVRM